MEIRSLDGPDDVRGAIEVHGRAWQAAYADLLPEEFLDWLTVEPEDADVREWRERMGGDCEEFLVAVDEAGSVRGYAYFRWGEDTKDFVGPNEAGLKEIYVDPDYWDQGIGTQLLERGVERLPEVVERLELEVLAENDVGRKFYEARGFERIDESEVHIAGGSYPTVIYARELDGSSSG